MNNFEKIEAYLLGQLSNDERQAFETALQNDADLRAELDRQRLEHRAIELAVRDDLRAQMAAWRAETEDQTTLTATVTEAPPMQVSFVRRNFFRIAAAASVLLVVGFFARSLFGPSGGGTGGDPLAYFDSTARSSGSDRGLPEALNPGLNALKRGNYAEAIAQFEAVTDANYKPQAALFIGEAYFRAKQYDRAVAAFANAEQLAITDDQRYEGQWFRFLSLKAAGRTAEAEDLRQKIAGDGDHIYQQAAEEMR